MPKQKLCTINNQTKGKPSRLPFVYIKEKILGKKYDLSISFVTPSVQKNINKKYRGINKTTNILSFSFSDLSGEITIDLEKVKKDSILFGMTNKTFLKYLFIHGLLHLKGFKHSSIMEKEEEKYMKYFS